MTDFNKLEQDFSLWNAKVEKANEKHPERKKQFVTGSNAPINRVYTPLDQKDFDYVKQLGLPGEFPLREEFNLRCIEVGYGPCGSMQVLVPQKNPINATNICSSRAKQGFPWLSICLPRLDMIQITPYRKEKWGK